MRASAGRSYVAEALATDGRFRTAKAIAGQPITSRAQRYDASKTSATMALVLVLTSATRCTRRRTLRRLSYVDVRRPEELEVAGLRGSLAQPRLGDGDAQLRPVSTHDVLKREQRGIVADQQSGPFPRPSLALTTYQVADP
jgi:hypothetical protein